MDVLVTGADSELGRMVAGTFKTAGHRGRGERSAAR